MNTPVDNFMSYSCWTGGPVTTGKECIPKFSRGQIASKIYMLRCSNGNLGMRCVIDRFLNGWTQLRGNFILP